jgi:hypothetical protein
LEVLSAAYLPGSGGCCCTNASLLHLHANNTLASSFLLPLTMQT